jgi:hypothetical protein
VPPPFGLFPGLLLILEFRVRWHLQHSNGTELFAWQAIASVDIGLFAVECILLQCTKLRSVSEEEVHYTMAMTAIALVPITCYTQGRRPGDFSRLY